MIGISGRRRCSSIGISQSGALRYGLLSRDEKPLWMPPSRVIPAEARRSKAPSQRLTSGAIGFFTKTGISVPLKVLASSWTEKGFTTVRAPIHSISTPYFKASSTCSGNATSIMTGIPKRSLASIIQMRPSSPTPSNESGRVRGFQMPPRNTCALPVAYNSPAVASSCSRDSTLHGPLMTSSVSGEQNHRPISKLSNINFYFLQI